MFYSSFDLSSSSFHFVAKNQRLHKLIFKLSGLINNQALNAVYCIAIHFELIYELASFCISFCTVE